MMTKFLALTISIFLGLYAVFLYTKPISPGAEHKAETIHIATSPQAESELHFSPATLQLRDFADHELIIALTTGNNELSTAQIELKYDPEKINITAIRAGELFSEALTPVNNPTQRLGRVEFALVLPENAPTVTGNGSLVILKLKRNPTATESATTTIDFLPKTSVRNQATSMSLLNHTTSATIELEMIPAPSPSL